MNQSKRTLPRVEQDSNKRDRRVGELAKYALRFHLVCQVVVVPRLRHLTGNFIPFSRNLPVELPEQALYHRRQELWAQMCRAAFDKMR
jgi:hypothetical protein